MNLNVIQKLLIHKDVTIQRLKAQAEINETTLIRLSDLEQKLNLLDSRIDHLENSISQLGQALVEGPGIDPAKFGFQIDLNPRLKTQYSLKSGNCSMQVL